MGKKGGTMCKAALSHGSGRPEGIDWDPCEGMLEKFLAIWKDEFSVLRLSWSSEKAQVRRLLSSDGERLLSLVVG